MHPTIVGNIQLYLVQNGCSVNCEHVFIVQLLNRFPLVHVRYMAIISEFKRMGKHNCRERDAMVFSKTWQLPAEGSSHALILILPTFVFL